MIRRKIPEGIDYHTKYLIEKMGVIEQARMYMCNPYNHHCLGCEVLLNGYSEREIRRMKKIFNESYEVYYGVLGKFLIRKRYRKAKQVVEFYYKKAAKAGYDR